MKNFYDIVSLIETLRGKNGCPYDQKQTLKGISKDFLGECYELVDALVDNDNINLKEELGDVFFTLVFIMVLLKEKKVIQNTDEVFTQNHEKIVSRHPHVFKERKTLTADEVLTQWEVIKDKEKKERENIFEGLPYSAPPIDRFLVLYKRLDKKKIDLKSTTESLKKGIKDPIERDFLDLLYKLYRSKINVNWFLSEKCKEIEKRFRNESYQSIE